MHCQELFIIIASLQPLAQYAITGFIRVTRVMSGAHHSLGNMAAVLARMARRVPALLLLLLLPLLLLLLFYNAAGMPVMPIDARSGACCLQTTAALAN
jgi:uncharacterized membrane protein